MKTNDECFNRAKELFPGGVHSPVRSFKGLDMAPRFMTKGAGAYIEDIEGKNYVDFCMSFGPLILGHNNSNVTNKLKAALENGTSFGASEPYSIKLGEYILERLSKVGKFDQIRFVNSGTEAVMTALRLARGHTKKNKIIKFDGCYHGHCDSMLIKSGSGLAGTADASSAGVPPKAAEDTLIVPLGDTDTLAKCFNDHKDEIAAVIIEPLPANYGLLEQGDEFLKFVRQITQDNNSLLIFDEVISGFRVSFGGMTEITGIQPDILTLGKIIGGGLPVGAISASKEIMENLAPVGDVYQAGTLSANPLAMVAGLATLEQLNNDVYAQITANTQQIVELFNEWICSKSEYESIEVISYKSLFWFKQKGKEINRPDQIEAKQIDNFNKMFKELLGKGIYLSPNAYEVGFASLAHNDKVIQDIKKRLWD